MKIKMVFFGIFLTAAFVLSCCSSEAVIQGVLGSTATSPVFLDCRASSATEISFRFSRPVSVKSLRLDPPAEVLSCENGEEIIVTLSGPLAEGAKMTADILVEDEHRNTLNVLTPFTARNNRMPGIYMNELRLSGNSFGDSVRGKIEFIEFITTSAGNLGALRVFAASHSLTEPVFEFPSAETAAGEYIVLHMRTTLPGCVDETGNDRALSGGIDALPGARDFWVPGSEKLLHDTDAIYLVDQDDRIIDAVLLSESAGPSWSKNRTVGEAAALFAAQGAWLPAGANDAAAGTYALTPNDAVLSASATPTRTVCRDKNATRSGLPANWYITVNSGLTPGKPNNEKRYVPPKK